MVEYISFISDLKQWGIGGLRNYPFVLAIAAVVMLIIVIYAFFRFTK